MSKFKNLVILGGDGNYKLTEDIMFFLDQEGIKYDRSHIDVCLLYPVY